MISRKDIITLSKLKNKDSISIFIPTHRAGKETLNGMDSIQLKNQVKEVRSKLETRELKPHEIQHLLDPVEALMEDAEFWRYQSDGLAIFCSNNFFEKYEVPVDFEAFNYVSEEFYTKPLVPLINDNGLFYLLTLSQDEVNLYECTRNSITDIKIDDVIPQRLEDSVGYDYEDKSLQVRSHPESGESGPQFHGHGAGQEEEIEKELERFIRDVNDGIMELLHDDHTSPMVLFCQDNYFSIYKEVNSYENLFPKHLSGNPKGKGVTELQQKAWELVEPHFEADKEQKIFRFSEFLGTGKASADIRDIVPAAFEGKVDALLIQNNADVYGKYNADSHEIEVQEEPQPSNVSLLNLASQKVLQHGGSVYLLDKKQLPENNSKINALYRY